MRRGDGLGVLRLHEQLASDGTSVHLGWLVRAARLVAVKRLHPLHLADEVGIACVRQEAQRAMRVDHPNVVATLGVVRHPGELLAAMEYVPGASVAEIVSAAPAGLDPHVASAIVAGALRGISAARGAGGLVAPRGAPISAARILVGEDGRVRVIDFDVPGRVMAAAIVDDLPYASPEQLVRGGSGDGDARRDVYAASVVLWETLTGRPLFRAATVAAMLRKILSDVVPAPSRLAPWVPPELDAIVLRGLARDPGARFESASAMAAALGHASCAPEKNVARALTGMGLAQVGRRRALADEVQKRERRFLHTECNGGTSRQ